MKYVRFEKNGIVEQGFLDGGVVRVLEGPLEALSEKKSQFDVRDIKIIPPVMPSKVIAVGLNYIDHAKELKLPLPEEPLIFMKPPSSVIGPDEAISYPPGVKRLDYEAEMAIVIKKKAHRVSREDSGDYIFGYTCINDVTARDLQKKDGQWTRSKSFDTFCPLGPYIETEIDPLSLKLELLVNKTVRQSSNTSKMIFDCRQLVEFISGIMTLLPGDIIATGTPPGVGPLQVGDEVEVRLEKVGSLINRVEKL